MIRTFVLLVLFVAIATPAVLFATRRSSADIVTGEFSMEVDVTAPGPVNVGNTFNLDVLIEHDGAQPYQVAQWFIDNDETILDVTDTTLTAAEVRDPAAPAACGQASDNTIRVIAGCIDVVGPNLTYSGVAWHISFTCIEPGGANFSLGTIGTQTYVRADLVTNATVHTHTDGIECVGPTSTPTATATQTPTDTATPTKTPTITPTPVRYKLHLSPGVNEIGTARVGIAIDQGAAPPYTNVQWKLQWDPARVVYQALQQSAPLDQYFDVCQGPFLTSSALVIGCLNITDTTSFSGQAFEATFNCLYTGFEHFLLVNSSTEGAPETFVRIGSTLQPIFVRNTEVYCQADTDADGLPNWYEQQHECLSADSDDSIGDPDADLLSNIGEFAVFLDPCDNDTDDDGLGDGAEIVEGTTPSDPDTDDDLLLDGFEAMHQCLDPLSAELNDDPDGDTLLNVDEMSYHADPCDGDSDDDTLPDAFEVNRGMNPASTDTDADTLPDDVELYNNTDPVVLNPDPIDPNDDDDACDDHEELSADISHGGGRDPFNWWDFYDVTNEGRVDLTDTLVILEHFGHNGVDPSDYYLNRSAPDPQQPWRTARATDGIGVDLTDALISLDSFGHDCTGD